MNKPSCETCRFYKPGELYNIPCDKDGNPLGAGTWMEGQCRRRSPAGASSFSKWPIVYPHEWCGEYDVAAKPDAPPPPSLDMGVQLFNPYTGESR